MKTKISFYSNIFLNTLFAFIFIYGCGYCFGYEWSKTFGGTESEHGRSVQQTTDGGFIIVGSTKSFGAGNWDNYLIKTDTMGNEVWSKTFGGSRQDLGYQVQQTTDGGYIIVGSTGSFGGYYDVYLVKTDFNGIELWSRTFGLDSYYDPVDWGYSVQQTTDGGFIIAARTSEPLGLEPADTYLIKTDALGNEVWSKTFDLDFYDLGYSVQQTTDAGYIIAGCVCSEYAWENCDADLIKTDALGNEVWSCTFGGIYEDRGYSVQQTTDGGFTILGSTTSFVGKLYTILF
jgi:hypothetical protein